MLALLMNMSCSQSAFPFFQRDRQTNGNGGVHLNEEQDRAHKKFMNNLMQQVINGMKFSILLLFILKTQKLDFRGNLLSC